MCRLLNDDALELQQGEIDETQYFTAAGSQLHVCYRESVIQL